MKKLSIATVLVLSLALIGCGQSPADSAADSTPDNAAVTSSAEEQTVEETDTVEEAVKEPASESESTEGSESAAASEEAVPEELMIEVDGDKYMGIIKDGGFIIESCKSDKENLVVPDTLFDVPVQVVGNSCMTIQNVKTVTLPDTVKFVWLNAFAWASNLESIDLGEGLEGVGAEIFYYCPLIKEIRFPEGMKSIGGCLCIECGSLEKIYIPESVTEIDLLDDEPLVDLATCPNVVIVTPQGSVAEEAAVRSGIPVEYPAN